MGEWLASSWHDLPQLLRGTVVTLKLVGGSLAFGVAIGLVTALGRTYGPRWLRRVITAYIELFRGTPLLVQMFVVYYGLPDFGIVLSPMVSAYLTIGLNSGAYQSDYFRGAIQAVGGGQMLAARAIGMTRVQAIVHIILPQALRLVLPVWAVEPISLIKASAVAFLISVPDVMGQAKIIVGETFNALPTYFLVTIIYLVLVSILTLMFNQLEKRVRIPGLDVKLAASM
jgi:polar amino acid transport system permease protein